MADDANPHIFIGANNPPEPTPFDAFSTHIGDLYDEAKNFLDGEGVDSEAMAEAVSALMDGLRKAAKDADAARAAEKKPFDDAAKAVQAKWKPLLDRADLAVKTCKDALAPWLRKKDEEQRAAAAEAQRVADEAQRAAAEAMRAADATDLAAREAAETLLAEAKKAEQAATRAENARPQSAGGARAVTLRSYWTAEVVDLKLACQHYWSQNPEAFRGLIQQLADQDVRAAKRQIPGVKVTEEKRPV